MAPCDPEDRLRVLHALEQRFGIPRGVLGEGRLYQAADDRVFVGPDAVPEPVREDATVGGLLVARLQATVKPSTDFLQAFGDQVRRNVVDVAAEGARRYVAGEDLDRGGVEEQECSRGWVAVRFDGDVLGCGFLREDRIENVVPKGRRVGIEPP